MINRGVVGFSQSPISVGPGPAELFGGLLDFGAGRVEVDAEAPSEPLTATAIPSASISELRQRFRPLCSQTPPEDDGCRGALIRPESVLCGRLQGGKMAELLPLFDQVFCLIQADVRKAGQVILRGRASRPLGRGRSFPRDRGRSDGLVLLEQLRARMKPRKQKEQQTMEPSISCRFLSLGIDYTLSVSRNVNAISSACPDTAGAWAPRPAPWR
jgi:hypothetical protein